MDLGLARLMGCRDWGCCWVGWMGCLDVGVHVLEGNSSSRDEDKKSTQIHIKVMALLERRTKTSHMTKKETCLPAHHAIDTHYIAKMPLTLSTRTPPWRPLSARYPGSRAPLPVGPGSSVHCRRAGP
jgi:hypothetical protein